MVPTKRVLVPKVAELPTLQKMLQLLAPLTSATALPDPVVSVSDARTINTAAGSPCASNVTVPESWSAAPSYTPGMSVRPASSVSSAKLDARLPMSLYAAVVSD